MILVLVGLALALIWWLLMSLERFGVPFHRAGERVRGHLLEVLLYGAYPRVMLVSLVDVARACGSLTLSLLLPCLLFTLPMLAGILVASSHFAHRPVTVGEPVLVSLEYGGGDGHGPDWQFQPSAQIEVEVDDFRHPLSGAHLWRIKPLAEGRLALVFKAEGRSTVKELVVGKGTSRLNETRYPLGWDWLLSPLEAPLPRGLKKVSVQYPERMLTWNGYSAPWWLLLLLAFLGWSWLLALLPLPRHWARLRES